MADQVVKQIACTKCGSQDITWKHCWDCGGEGTLDLHELDANYYLPGETDDCDTCDGNGGWWHCHTCDRPNPN